jgi:hypothetical protein
MNDHSYTPRQSPGDATALVSVSPLTAADAFAEIRANTSLSPIRKRDETSALTALVRMCRPVDAGTLTASTVDRVARLVVLECEWLRGPLFAKPAAFHGYAQKRFDAVLTLVRATLRRLGVHAPPLPPAQDLSEKWRILADASSKYRVLNLIGFFGFCSLSGIEPDEVRPATLDRYEAYLTTKTLERKPGELARRSASTWNWSTANVAGFPQVRLERANMCDHYAPSWEVYGGSVRGSVDEFLDWLAGLGNADIAEAMFSEAGPKVGSRPIKRKMQPRTISTRRDCLKIAFAALVRTGVPVDEIQSSLDLVSPPARARQVMRFHLQRTQDHLRSIAKDGEVPPLHEITSSNLFNVNETLRKVAIFHQLPEAEIQAIAAMGRQVTKPRQGTMTDRNRRLLAALIQPEIMVVILALPQKLMKRALKMERNRAAAGLALVAVALEILIMAPVRRENIAALHLIWHLLRAWEGAPIHEIFIPANKVKNQAVIEAPLPAESSELIETYLREFRMLLTLPDNPYLFPSDDLEPRQAAGLYVKLKTIVEQETGCEWNGHIMRHFAVYRHLEKNPGDFDGAARLLGDHPDTVRRFYDGLTTRFAAKKYSDSIVDDRRRNAASTKKHIWLRRSGRESET